MGCGNQREYLLIFCLILTTLADGTAGSPAKQNKIDSTPYIYSRSNLNTNFHKEYEADIARLMYTYKEPNIKHESKLPRNKRDAETNYDSSEKLLGYFKSNPTRYVELGIVADTREYKSAGANESALNKRFMDIVNVANSLFAPLNIVIVLVDVVVWTERDEFFVGSNDSITLHGFKDYVNSLPQKNNDFTILITYDRIKTARIFTDSMCKKNWSIAITNDRYVIEATGMVFAHLIGMALNMPDDDEFSQCLDKPGIMTKYFLTPLPTHWSYCSLKALKEFYDSGKDSCLRNKP